ncbi:GAF domain-containing protein [Mycolicibacterium obuense]|uniref:GAF domain-containing protein n=1 Tax=Mycolicibacterium obuense TaxID=1807 RepID=A0A0M2JWP7_9MYCO|nr:GAF domain-containing protein [Mycolicibacterium obuense]KKF01502.1 hypothetical protein WN67_13210 [Mycolicibacterium obuense]
MWVLFVAGVISPAAGTFLVTIGQNREDKGDWGYLLSGIAVLFFGGFLLFGQQWASRLITKLDLKIAEQFRITIKDALQGVAELISEMPGQSRSRRRNTLITVAIQSVGALTLLLKDVHRLRATVYHVNDAGNMECMAYLGRGDGVKPQPFLKGTDRGDRALRFVATARRPLFVPNVHSPNAVRQYGGSKAGYETFISASIHTDDLAYGMVTIDAPRAGTLLEMDQHLVALVADLLAIAFAMAEHSTWGAFMKIFKTTPDATQDEDSG